MNNLNEETVGEAVLGPLIEEIRAEREAYAKLMEEYLNSPEGSLPVHVEIPQADEETYVADVFPEVNLTVELRLCWEVKAKYPEFDLQSKFLHDTSATAVPIHNAEVSNLDFRGLEVDEYLAEVDEDEKKEFGNVEDLTRTRQELVRIWVQVHDVIAELNQRLAEMTRGTASLVMISESGTAGASRRVENVQFRPHGSGRNSAEVIEDMERLNFNRDED